MTDRTEQWDKTDAWLYGPDKPILLGIAPAQAPQPVAWRTNTVTGEREWIVVAPDWRGSARQLFIDRAHEIQRWVDTR